jgi:phage terminase large subunit GpA-like protein
MTTHKNPAAQMAAVERRVLEERLRPPPRLTVSQWADRYRVLSPEGSFRAGPFNSDDAPYQREFMDICGDPRYQSVVGMWASQSGKTETLNCVAGYYIDQDPSPILMLQPTEKMAEAWSKDRLAPMLRDTPRLKGKVSDARSRDSGNTILHKQFPGGHLTVAGSNSPASLASRPIRILLLDEIDRYPPSAGSEGDPAAIAESRTATFPNRKIIRVSSPTLKGSPIEQAWESSDQRWFFVPCPHCGNEQKLEFGGAKTNHGLKWDAGLPETAHYVCAACSAVIEESDKLLMLKNGRWIPDNPASRVPGFRLSALYSPFFPWSRLIERWLRDKGDPLKLRTFVNTMLCEPWEETGEGVTAHILQDRLEPFPEKDGEKLIPAKAAILTRSVDVQGDRLETCVYAWADGEEAWRVDFELIPGDPATAAPWDELARMIAKPYKHELGSVMRCAATFIDSGGHHAKEAYEFARGRVRQRVFAIKGSSLQQGVPLLSKPTRNPSAKIIMYSVGSFTGKEVLMSRLSKVTEPGPGYIHLPEDIDPQHLDQFLNERIVTRFVKGRPVRAWVRSGPNEQIDMFVYALAALHSLGPNVFRRLGVITRALETQAKARAEEPASTDAVVPEAPEAEEEPSRPRKKKPRRSGWVDGWR